MQSRDFVFWLQGFFELTDTQTLTPNQVELIKAHLDLVFKHDPSIPRHQMEHKKIPHDGAQPAPFYPANPGIMPNWDLSKTIVTC